MYKQPFVYDSMRTYTVTHNLNEEEDFTIKFSMAIDHN